MGRASARRFASSGDTVVIADLDASAVDELAAELRAGGSTVIGLAFDMTDAAAVAGLAETLREAGTLRAVAHTAGLSPTMANWERVLSVNLVGSVLLLDALDPLDRANRAGIDDSGAAYGWSKWALRRLVVDRAPSWGERGARIVSLSPGIVDTPMGRRELEQQPAMPTIVELTPLRRMGHADEIAATIEFLCSEAASFITGTDLLVDGGSTEVLKTTIQALAGDISSEG
jgi:NAD(P)-dependent dehydrogenase (short-subunit alcohol dehydrogenase family)